MKVGVLGGGQLARMMALSAYPLGIEIICIDPASDACASEVTKVVHAEFDDFRAIEKIFNGVDCITYETENLPVNHIEPLAKKYKLLPSIEALKITQDRLYEKEFLNRLELRTAPYMKIDEWSELVDAMDRLQFPLVLKTRRNGYDGKGQFVIHDHHQAKEAWDELGQYPLIAEKMITFENEISLISVRSMTGETRFYPLILNEHKNGILRVSQAPYADDHLRKIAENYAMAIMQELNYAGVMTIEFFAMNGELLVNEIAPRVHNSGHWTIEGAETSQFENHLRSICGLPLGSTAAKSLCGMINIISERSNPDDLLAIDGLHYHWYGKQPRLNRKLGHVTICADHTERQSSKLKEALNLISPQGGR